MFKQVPPSGVGAPPFYGYRQPPPWPRPRAILGVPNSSYPTEGYYTTGYPQANIFLRKPAPWNGYGVALGQDGLEQLIPRAIEGVAPPFEVALNAAIGAVASGKGKRKKGAIVAPLAAIACAVGARVAGAQAGSWTETISSVGGLILAIWAVRTGRV